MRLTTELPDNTDIPMSDDERLSIGCGLADADAGRMTDGDVVFQHLRARVCLSSIALEPTSAARDAATRLKTLRETGMLLPATANEPVEPLGLVENA